MQILAVAFGAWLALAPATTHAWTSDPTVNDAVCTATNGQTNPEVINDGSGGYIFAWSDGRSGNADIYAQRFDGSGTPLWTVNGVAVCTATLAQTMPRMVSDGSGGAIIAWIDNRAGASNEDIYAQRINSAGATQWTVNGDAVCTATTPSRNMQITSDGAGGAIMAWSELLAFSQAILCQRINNSGAVQWPVNGVEILMDNTQLFHPQLVSDGHGGAFVAFEEEETDGQSGIADINSSGSVSDVYPVNGSLLEASDPRMVFDGDGGAFVAWVDQRSTSSDIYAQHFTPSLDDLWGLEGISICSAPGAQFDMRLVSDGSGGVIIAWKDHRSGSEYAPDIYAQRLDGAGTAQWATDGISVYVGGELENFSEIQLVSDGSNGAILSWAGMPNEDESDIYAQRIDSSGVVQWTANGIVVCTGPADQVFQNFQQMAGDGSGGAVITWRDPRAGNEIYASKIQSNGVLVPITLSKFAIE